MTTGEIYIFTVRNRIQDEPRIVQERFYVAPYELKLINCFDIIFSAEKDKKKPDKELKNK